MNKKKVGVGIIFLVLIGTSILYSGTRFYGQGTVTGMLIIENGGTIRREADIPEGSNVLDLMTVCGIPFEGQGGFVTSINGISQDEAANKYWIYYINGEYAPVGASEYIVQDGDEILWKLESF